MNKQEVIDEIENVIPGFILNDYQRGKETGLTYALELVEELDDPEKPVVPQFVADWYEEHKDNFENELSFLIYNYFKGEIEENLLLWFGYDFNKTEPIQTLVNMHQFGYEVEKEKLYTVEIPNPNRDDDGYVMLARYFNDVCIDWFYNDNCKKLSRVQLTEAEIKKDFDWAWQFAEGVEE